MTARYVAIDTETTGLDPEADEIIEVAAIAFGREGGVEGEFHSLVRPSRPPSYHIERLTGIEAAALASAPSFAALAAELADFIADSPVVGQNVEFDLAFLARGGVRSPAPAFDTYELARLLLPGLADYSLRGIAEGLGLEMPVRHRARADAEAARLVFLRLRRLLSQQPVWLLQELERLLRAAGGLACEGLSHLLREVMAEAPAGEAPIVLTSAFLAPPEDPGRPLATTDVDASVSQADVLRLLRKAAGLTAHFPAFEERPQQEAMAAAVNRALNEGRHLLVEAGTGVGKSLAYLLPAALHALRRGERVVVSTDTIGLQEQLVEKDLPAVQALLGSEEGEALRVASLKGRRNYLCLQRWTAARHTAPATKEEAKLLARLLVWLRQTQTGDRAELNLHGEFEAAWSRLSAENAACLQTGCSFVREGTCFLQRARRRAEAAHLLVVNHALLLSDVAAAGHVLPPYDHLIIDEAHNLEEEATARFAFRAAEGDVADFLERVGRAPGRGGAGRAGPAEGIVGSLAAGLRAGEAILGPGAYLAGLASALGAAAGRVRGRLARPFRLLDRVLRECGPDDRDDGDRLLITRATRVQPLWSELQVAAAELDSAFVDLLSLLDDLRSLLEGPEQGIAGQEVLAAEAADLLQAGSGLQRGLAQVLLEEDGSLICWLERSRASGEVAVCSAPLEVASILRRELFEARRSVVLTSATLSAEGRFDFLRSRIGLDDAEELLLGSPFDYPAQTLILLPEDLPDPNEPDFVAATAELLVEALRASGGRALVLFTAYGMLNAVYDLVRGPLEAEGILVLAHGQSGSPRQLLAALREDPRTVVLGTASFWEGVDVAGEALSLLVIVRLPFAVPTDPVYQARSALYDEPFEEYALPQAVLRFRQGFGRLIRSKTDRGVLLLLDRRVRQRRYGEAFLRSLPRCTVREMPGREVAAAVAGWLSRASL